MHGKLGSPSLSCAFQNHVMGEVTPRTKTLANCMEKGWRAVMLKEILPDTPHGSRLVTSQITIHDSLPSKLELSTHGLSRQPANPKDPSVLKIVRRSNP